MPGSASTCGSSFLREGRSRDGWMSTRISTRVNFPPRVDSPGGFTAVYDRLAPIYDLIDGATLWIAIEVQPIGSARSGRKVTPVRSRASAAARRA